MDRRGIKRNHKLIFLTIDLLMIILLSVIVVGSKQIINIQRYDNDNSRYVDNIKNNRRFFSTDSYWPIDYMKQRSDTSEIFISETVEGKGIHFINELPKLDEIPEVKSLHLIGIECNLDIVLRAMKNNTHIDSFYFHGIDTLNDIGLNRLLETFPQLKTIWLGACTNITDKGLESLSKLKNLKQLGLEIQRNNEFGTVKQYHNDFTGQTLSQLQQIQMLTFFSDNNHKIFQTIISEICDLSNLEILILEDVDEFECQYFFETLNNRKDSLKKLKFLYLKTKANLKDEPLHNIRMINAESLQNLKKLEFFILDYKYNVPIQFGKILLPSLRIVDLTSNDYTFGIDDDVTDWLANCRSLETIFINSSQFTGSKLHLLADLPQLKRMTLFEFVLSDNGMKHLSTLIQLKELTIGLPYGSLNEIHNDHNDVYKEKIASAQLNLLNMLSKLKQLEELKLVGGLYYSDCTILESIKHVRKLYLELAVRNDIPINTSLFENFDHLEELSFRYLTINSSGSISDTNCSDSKKLSSFEKIRNLKKLALLNNYQNNDLVLLSQIKNLKHLIFSHTISQQNLDAIEKIPSLEALRLRNNNESSLNIEQFLKNKKLKQFAMCFDKSESEFIKLTKKFPETTIKEVSGFQHYEEEIVPTIRNRIVLYLDSIGVDYYKH
ncbi:MAG: hypothetical protein Q4B70_16940 [Lachnospiraceae bacterium]|nr:hypothetical protein [Lachnospiraceae bacterium]